MPPHQLPDRLPGRPQLPTAHRTTPHLTTPTFGHDSHLPNIPARPRRYTPNTATGSGQKKGPSRHPHDGPVTTTHQLVDSIVVVFVLIVTLEKLERIDLV